MEKKKTSDLSILRPRSSGAVISDGYKLYMNKFRSLFRSSWIAALIYAVVTGFFMSIAISRLPETMVLQFTGNIENPAFRPILVTTGLLLLGGALLFLIATATLASYGFSALGEQMASGSISSPTRWFGRIDKPVLLRTLKALLWVLLIAVIAAAIYGGTIFISLHYLGKIAGTILIVLTILLLLALILPLNYTFMKYVLTPRSAFIRTLSSSYSTGMRHWGSLFLVTLVVGIVTSLLTLITELPANILYAANMQSQLGSLQGDPLGMPSYMTWMNIVVFTIAGFIQAYVHLSSLFPFGYLYGSIETQELERKQNTLS